MTDVEPIGVGPLGAEVPKLLGALFGWARKHAAEAGHALWGSPPKRQVSAAQRPSRHKRGQMHGLSRVRAASAMRQISPEVSAHLSAAVGSLAQAAAALLATTDRRATKSDRSLAEHIDLDDDWPDTK